MKVKSLSPNILKNKILSWAERARADEKYVWTKHDANAKRMLEKHIKSMIHDIYVKDKMLREAEKMNPYINKDNPYHTKGSSRRC